MRSQLPFHAFVTRLFVPVVLASPFVGASFTAAREYAPYIMYVFPPGGQRGTTVEGIMARGRGLEGTSEVRISGQGVTTKVLAVEEPSTRLRQRSANRQDQAENPNVVKFTATIAPDAEPGERDLWLITPKGPTNRFHFVVGQVPEVNEVDEEPDTGAAQALPSLPILVNGQINQGDEDLYRFTAKAGQKLVCEVQGQKLVPYIADAVPGWLQCALTLYDGAGKELEYVDDFRFHPDPLLIYNVKRDGEYVLGVKDTLFRGREDMVYRLSIGALPFITHIYPLGGRRGSDAQVELHGANLPAASVKLTLPDDAPRQRRVQVNGEGGLKSNALPFAVGDLPEADEEEPNNAPAQAQRVEFPLTINGRIQQPGDADYFVFSAKAKQTLMLDVRARRLDSPLDSILSLLDARGRTVVENDDTEDLSAGLVTHHADSRLTHAFRADGDYLLRIGDVQRKGGAEYAYRLTIAPPRADFDLRFFPANLSVAQGGAAVAKVKAYRQDGFNGEIRLAVEGLPPGFIASPAVIAAGQTETRLTISAPPEAARGVFSPTVTGTATIADQKTQAEKRAAAQALAKVKAELGKADTEYKTADKAAREAEAAAAKAKAALTKTAAAQLDAQNAAALKRKQADEAKKKVALLQTQEKVAAADLAAAAKAATDAARAKAAADRASAEAETASADLEQDHDAAEKAAREAEASAKSISEDAGKSDEEKKKARAEAAAKRQAANAAKTALTEAQEKKKQARAQAEAAAKDLARAETQKKSAEEALAKVKKQVTDATTTHREAEKAAQAAETSPSLGETEVNKARAAHAAREKAATAKRRLADAAGAKRDRLASQEKAASARLAAANRKPGIVTVRRQALPAEELMQAFYYWHDVPTQECLLAAVPSTSYTLTTDLPPVEVREVTQGGQLNVVVKASREGIQAMVERLEAKRKAAQEALARVKGDLQTARAAYTADEKAAREAERSAASAKTAAARAPAALATAQRAVAPKRQQADQAKKQLDALVAERQKPAEAKLAAATRAATDAASVKTAKDKALAAAKAATAKAEQTYDEAEKAAGDAAATAKVVSENATKSEEEKKNSTAEATAKRKAADDAKNALNRAQENEKQAATQASAAARDLAQAEAQKKPLEQVLAHIKNQVAAATQAYQTAEKAARAAERAAATAKAELEKARAAQAATAKAAVEKRKLADDAKARRDKLTNDEKTATAKLAEAKKNVDTATRATRAPISLKADTPPRGITVKAARIAADQDQATVTVTVTNRAPIGHQSIVLIGTLKAGPDTLTGVVPAIPIKVVAKGGK